MNETEFEDEIPESSSDKNVERLCSPYVFNKLEEAQYHNKMQDVRIRDLENIVDFQWKVILAIGLTSLINVLSGMIL